MLRCPSLAALLSAPHASHGMPLPSRRNIIRLAPPLVINEEQLHEASGIIKKVFSEL